VVPRARSPLSLVRVSRLCRWWWCGWSGETGVAC